jgi:hypothetical protein
VDTATADTHTTSCQTISHTSHPSRVAALHARHAHPMWKHAACRHFLICLNPKPYEEARGMPALCSDIIPECLAGIHQRGPQAHCSICLCLCLCTCTRVCSCVCACVSPARTTSSLQPWHGHKVGTRISAFAGCPCGQPRHITHMSTPWNPPPPTNNTSSVTERAGN